MNKLAIKKEIPYKKKKKEEDRKKIPPIFKAEIQIKYCLLREVLLDSQVRNKGS